MVVFNNYFYIDTDYNLRWKISKSGNNGKDSLAGGVNKDGYRRVKLNNKEYKVHNIIWDILNPLNLLQHNELVDHVDGNTLNNNINNLRKVTHRENQQNRTEHRKGKLVGCNFNKYHNKWDSRIFIEHKSYHLGYFNTEIEAHIKYTKTLQVYLNTGIFPIIQTSSYIYFDKRVKRFYVRKYINKKMKSFGGFLTMEEAEQKVHTLILNHWEG